MSEEASNSHYSSSPIKSKSRELNSRHNGDNDVDSHLLKSLNEEEEADRDASKWTSERVRKWLVQVGLDELYGMYMVSGDLVSVYCTV